MRPLRLTLLLLGAAALVAPAGATAARYDGWSPSSGTDVVDTLTDVSTSADAFTGASDRVELSLTSTVAQHLRITVQGPTGGTLRTVVDADVPAGPGTW